MGEWLKWMAWAVFFAGGLLLALYATLFDVWTVPTDDPLLSASIEPTLSAGDLVVLSRHGSPGRSDLLRCPDPQAPGRFVVARAIARSGEKITLESEFASVDDRRTPSPHACDPPSRTMRDPSTNDDVELSCNIEDYGGVEFTVLRAAAHPSPPMQTTVTGGLWFLLSDNRHLHLDSRDYGPLDTQACKHIVFRIVSAGGIGDSKSRFSIIW
jgi:signal peptidase I